MMSNTSSQHQMFMFYPMFLPCLSRIIHFDYTYKLLFMTHTTSLLNMSMRQAQSTLYFLLTSSLSFFRLATPDGFYFHLCEPLLTHDALHRWYTHPSTRIILTPR
jgi:hypothetical protein